MLKLDALCRYIELQDRELPLVNVVDFDKDSHYKLLYSRNERIISFLMSKGNFEEIKKGIASVLAQRKEFSKIQLKQTKLSLISSKINGSSYSKVIGGIKIKIVTIFQILACTTNQKPVAFIDQNLEKLIRED